MERCLAVILAADVVGFPDGRLKMNIGSIHTNGTGKPKTRHHKSAAPAHLARYDLLPISRCAGLSFGDKITGTNGAMLGRPPVQQSSREETSSCEKHC